LVELPFPFRDIRDFIEFARSHNEVQVVKGADAKLEIGAITELLAQKPNPPLVVFDEIPGFKPGYRVAANLFNNPLRTAAVLGLKEGLKGVELVKAWKDSSANFKSIKAREVSDGPVNENVMKGDKINILEFPAPMWHEGDGGNYIGTGCSVITKHPDEGWVNVGTYRVMTTDKKDKLSIMIVGGKHGDLNRKLYFEKGKNCPIVISFGQEPTFFVLGGYPVVPGGIPFFDFVSGVRGEPVEYLVGESGLPIPATAELVIEGELLPESAESVMEGPFGEWPGYVTGARPQPIIKISEIRYRNNPIVHGSPPLKPPLPEALGYNITTSAALWREMEQHIPELRGVWCANEGGTGGTPGYWVVISIRQRYPGHAKHAALAACGCRAGAYAGRYIIVVDEDIDPSNLGDVVWAIATRCDPGRGIDIIRDCWDSPCDPLVFGERRMKGDITDTRAIINACRPYHAFKEFPAVATTGPELAAQMRKKFAKILS
jgi:4-hydroxy-3-polyprenylbenzoate decarboxylase